MKGVIGLAIVSLAVLLASSFLSFPALAFVSFSYTYVATPTVIEPGTNANILLTLTNTGTEFSGSTKVIIAQSRYITAGISSFDLQTVKSGGGAQIVVPITVSPDSPEGVTILPFTISYTTSDNAATTELDGSIAITVVRRTIMQIVDVSFDKAMIQAGDNVKMTLSILDNGQGLAKNLLVSLPISNVPIAPTMSDFEEYVGTLTSGQRTDVTFEFVVNTNADATIYSIPVTLSYYDDLGNFRNETKYVGLKVTGVPSFVVSLDSTTNVFLNANGQISVSIANTGTGVAKFVTANVDSNLKISPTVNYLGDLNPDDTNTLILNVNPTTLGIQTVNVSLSYRDSYNQQFSQSYPINFDVERVPFTFPFTYVVLIIVVILVLAYWKRNAILKRGK